MASLHPLIAAASWTGIAWVVACEPTVVVGTWDCAQAPWVAQEAGSGDAQAAPFPWSTSFERGFCDYAPPEGFCYSPDYASYRVVNSPVHSGEFAAAFTVSSDSNRLGVQARCVRNGVLPTSAYYGAWYYFPEARDNTGNWNLFHFQGGTGPEDRLHGLWDLSLANDPAGGLRLTARDGLRGALLETTGVPPIPIGAWVHLQFYWKRAADSTGEVTVYQDGVVALHRESLVTDDSAWGQWYVGNLADAIQPPASTVYVDDVAIDETR